MEFVKILWVVNFFFFSMIIFFVWSKMYLISRKIKRATALLGEIETFVSGQDSPETAPVPKN